MAIETLEKNQLEQTGINVSTKLGSLHESFQSTFDPKGSAYEAMDTAVIDDSIRQSFDIAGDVKMTPEIRAAAVNSVKDMYHGYEVNGHQSLSLKEINGWKINDAYRESNLNQHAGYAAEVISTNKENFNANLKHSGEITYRADDLPKELLDQFDGKIAAKNDQYVDKVRVKADGTVETVQTKFVGKDAESCLKKLTSKDYAKYLEDGKVDKIEIPKEFYKEVKADIKTQRRELSKQYAKLSGDSTKSTEAAKIKNQLDDLKKLDQKLEPSCVTKAEAQYAVEHPKLYAAQQINNAALKQGAQAAALTAAVSGVQNYQKYEAGEITGEEAILNTLKDTAVYGGIAYGTEVATQFAGGSSIPGAVITMGVTSASDIKDCLDGKITEEELAYNLGENTASVIGGTVGGAIGGTIGSVAGPAGTAVGAMVGSAVGSAVASEAYQVTVEFTKNTAEDVKDFIDGEIDEKELAQRVGENVETAITEVKESIDETAATIVEVGETVKEAAVYVVNDVGGKVEELSNVVVEKLDAVTDMAAEVTDAVADKAVELKDAAAEKLDDAADKAAELKDAAFAKVTGLFNSN